MTHPVLVTGAAGRVGGAGGLVVEALQRRGLPVRDAGRGCLHRVSKNPGKLKTRLIAVVPHPRDAKEVATPKSKRE